MPTLSNAPTYFRTAVTRGSSQVVERDAGRFGAGVIRNVSVAARGEALGHELWVDGVFLSQIADGINAVEMGVKSRFNHPSASGDALGTQVGKVFDARADGDKVYADLHILESASKTPDGNLAEYVLSMAEEAPEDFGVSIAFMPDFAAIEAMSGKWKTDDPNNEHNYPHARLTKLKAADVVDEPAANPDGLFSRGNEVPAEADRLLSYAFGLSADQPATVFGVHPERLRGFAQRWMSQHGLAIQENQPMAESTATPTPVAVDQDAIRKQFAADLDKYQKHFGDALGAEYFKAGWSWAEAVELHNGELQKHIKQLSAEIGDLKARIASLDTSEKEPASFSERPAEIEKPKRKVHEWGRPIGESLAAISPTKN